MQTLFQCFQVGTKEPAIATIVIKPVFGQEQARISTCDQEINFSLGRMSNLFKAK